MSTLIVLDDSHMTNRLYMKAFGPAVRALLPDSVIIVHDCADHAEALIQTGLMRHDASVRAARETNLKLVGWLADFGIAATSVQGDRRGLVRRSLGHLALQPDLFATYPANTVRVVATLAEDADGRPICVSTHEMAGLIQSALTPKQVFFASDMGKSGFFQQKNGGLY
jgi:hypothetical protein